jgi:hypothetical protein
MKFKELWKNEERKSDIMQKTILLFEHEVYKRIPGTSASYQTHSGNINTNTIKHSHVYATLKGIGRELYAVNKDGSGHDGSEGIKIPSKHADHFRGKGYEIGLSNILETLELNRIDKNEYILILLEDA